MCYNLVPMKVLVVYESRTGNTRSAAELIGGAALRAGATEVNVQPITDIDLKHLAEADLVFVGTWVDGLFVIGQRPGGAGRIWRLPPIDNKPVATFCTYAHNPGRTLRKLAGILEARGAVVVEEQAFHRRGLTVGLDAYVADAVAAVPAPAVG